MKIALIGYGRMGKRIAELASERVADFDVVAIIDPIAKEATAKEITKENLHGAEVAIDFTTPEVILDNIKKIAKTKTNLVIGTTGWYDQLKKAKKIVDDNNIGMLYASNFSIGIQAFFRIVRAAAKIMNCLDDYDIFASEIHHRNKLDSPSGTALSLGEILLKEIERKDTLVTNRLDRAPKPKELHLMSLRGGEVPGIHEAYFDSSADMIRLTHTARNRDGFALGALFAAKWIKNKKGLFNAEEWIEDLFGK